MKQAVQRAAPALTLLLLHKRRQEFRRSIRSGQRQANRPGIRLDRQFEAEKPAALPLGVDRRRDGLNGFGGRTELQADAVRQRFGRHRPPEQFREQFRFPGSNGFRTQGTGDWQRGWLSHRVVFVEQGRPASAPKFGVFILVSEIGYNDLYGWRLVLSMKLA